MVRRTPRGSVITPTGRCGYPIALLDAGGCSPARIGRRGAVVVLMAGLVLLGGVREATAQSDGSMEPPPPVKLRVVAEGDGSVTVGWDVSEVEEGRLSASGYRFLYRLAAPEPGAQPTNEGWYYRPGDDVGSDVRQLRVQALTRDVWYEVTVAAVHDRGLVWSEETVSAYSGGAVPRWFRLPGAPADVRVVGEGLGSVTVAWDPPADHGGSPVSGYEVWYISLSGLFEDGSWVMSGEMLGGDAREWVIEGLVDFEEYYVIVAAVGESGRGVFSQRVYAVASRGGLDPPAAPKNVRLVAEGDGSVTVAWDSPEAEEGRRPPTGFRVRYRPAAIEPGSQPNPPGWPGSSRFASNVREGTVEGLANDVWYEVRVASVAGDWSDATVAARPGTTPVTARLSGVPRNVRVVGEGLGSVTVAWDPPAEDISSVTGYEVWYVRRQDRNTPGSYAMSAEMLPADTSVHTVGGLVDYQRYEVIVAAVNSVGRGLVSSVWATANRDDHGTLGLIADHRFARSYSLDTDRWEVWVCDVADGHERVDLQDAVSLMNREVTPYFSWLSGRRYRPEFMAGGTVRADGDRSGEHAGDYDCDDRVEEVSEGGSEGVVIILDKNITVSHGGLGSRNSSYVDHTWQVTSGTFPENDREIELAASTVLPTSAYCPDCRYRNHIDLDIVAHEMGHALGWPHSFGGIRPETSEAFLEIGQNIDEYDNPMDLMSGSPNEPQLGTYGLVAGTIAPNRYAAGWIDPQDVAIHQELYGSYLLAPIGRSGIQMLVLPSAEPGYFISLGARVARGYDAGIPEEGVEIYRVDQRASACDEATPENPGRLSCTGLHRRSQQVPAPHDDDREVEELTGHVYGPGDGRTIDSFRIEVTGRTSGRFRVWVGHPYKGTFADDENNVHERSIDMLAGLGITQGCNPELKLYCPDQPVTRAQMATLLILALGETGTRRSGPSRFTDVASDAWYRPYVERLAELGITVGFSDGTLRPDVPVTRGQMAVFLTRAFDGVDPVDTPTGVFADVPANASYTAAVEGVHEAGVTAGCSKTPGRNYCPRDQVRRDQIASFLIRALGGC